MATPEILSNPLDAEIASLQEELATLRRAIKIECSTILSSASFQSRRSKHRLSSSSSSSSSTTSTSSKHPSKSKHKPSTSSASSTSSTSTTSSPSHSTSHKPSSSSNPSSSSSAPPSSIAAAAALHAAHAQQSTYRIAASITAFHVRDPDPHAVDRSRILGLRFEALARGRFLTPYYVLLNRPFPGSKHLRVHRHTVPPAVPLAGLAGRYLPAPGPTPVPDKGSSPDKGASRPHAQDLHAFATKLRREIARYHNRLGASADLRRTLAAQANIARENDHDNHDDHGDDASTNQGNLDADADADAGVDLAIADVEAKHISISWPASDRSARIIIDDDGALVNAVVMGPQGRDWLAARQLFGDHERVPVHVHDIIKGMEEE